MTELEKRARDLFDLIEASTPSAARLATVDFAEKIVREAARAAAEHLNHFDFTDGVQNHITEPGDPLRCNVADAILEHFGLKEK